MKVLFALVGGLRARRQRRKPRLRRSCSTRSVRFATPRSSTTSSPRCAPTPATRCASSPTCSSASVPRTVPSNDLVERVKQLAVAAELPVSRDGYAASVLGDVLTDAPQTHHLARRVDRRLGARVQPSGSRRRAARSGTPRAPPDRSRPTRSTAARTRARSSSWMHARCASKVPSNSSGSTPWIRWNSSLHCTASVRDVPQPSPDVRQRLAFAQPRFRLGRASPAPVAAR